MINETDNHKMQELMESNPLANEVISKLIQEHNLDVSRISHELRNPITLINSSLQLIQSQHPEVKEFKFWNETMDDLKYVRCLLEELSNCSRSHTLNKALFNVKDLINSTCASMIGDTYNTTRSLTFTSDNQVPEIEADPIKLRQVLINLLRNARDAINPKSGKVHIHLFQKDLEYIQIDITDNGCGIPSEYDKDIFEPFITHKEKGTGLGLSIVKNIVLAHNGNISYTSIPNVETTFSIVLPIKN